jgi:hypothetical protein
MKKEDLIKQCRYYSGEETCPFNEDNMEWFWDMERVYVSCNGNFTGEMEIYQNLNGRTFKGIPYNLLMVMFTSWAKYVTDIANNLDKFYNLMELYLDIVSDHIEKGKIPNT